MAEKTIKTQYRIRNWSEYDAALKNRGSLTFWVDEEVLAGWLNDQKTGKRGASPFYSDLAIATMSYDRYKGGFALSSEVSYSQ